MALLRRNGVGGVPEVTKGCLLPCARRIGWDTKLALYKLWAILVANIFIAANPGTQTFLGQSVLHKCIVWNSATTHYSFLTPIRYQTRRSCIQDPIWLSSGRNAWPRSPSLAAQSSSDPLNKALNCSGLVSSDIIEVSSNNF